MTDHPQQQKSQYLTKWGRSLSEDSVLDEYPRPQLVRDQWQNLNGKWSYAIAPKRAPQPQHWDGEILVPFCIESALSGVARTLAPSERLWYQRRFNRPSGLGKGQIVYVCFAAVDCSGEVSLNGTTLGRVSGDRPDQRFAVTGLLQSANELSVVVELPRDDTNSDPLPPDCGVGPQ